MNTLYYIIVFGVMIVGYGIFYIFVMSKRRNQMNDFLQKHPDATKVYGMNKVGMVTQGFVSIVSVDGELPVYGHSTGKGFAYVLPGERIIEVTYTTSRPGVMHKTVTKEYGPVKLSVVIEKGKEYQLSFDQKTEQFEFAEK